MKHVTRTERTNRRSALRPRYTANMAAEGRIGGTGRCRRDARASLTSAQTQRTSFLVGEAPTALLHFERSPPTLPRMFPFTPRRSSRRAARRTKLHVYSGHALSRARFVAIFARACDFATTRGEQNATSCNAFAYDSMRKTLDRYLLQIFMHTLP